MSDAREDRPERHPAFWCAYVAPATHVAELVQQPLYLIDGERLAVAYMRDWRAGRKADVLRRMECES